MFNLESVVVQHRSTDDLIHRLPLRVRILLRACGAAWLVLHDYAQLLFLTFRRQIRLLSQCI